jgi:hypothetical protein
MVGVSKGVGVQKPTVTAGPFAMVSRLLTEMLDLIGFDFQFFAAPDIA